MRQSSIYPQTKGGQMPSKQNGYKMVNNTYLIYIIYMMAKKNTVLRKVSTSKCNQASMDTLWDQCIDEVVIDTQGFGLVEKC